MTPAPPPPARRLEQRLKAIDRANLVRTRRAALKARIKGRAFDVLVAALELDTRYLGIEEGTLDTMKVRALLLTVPKWGTVKVNRTLTQHGISPSKTLGGLSDRQRGELLVELGYHFPAVRDLTRNRYPHAA